MPRTRTAWAWLIGHLLRRRRTVISVVLLVGVILSADEFLGEWRRVRLDVEEVFQNSASEHFVTIKQEIGEAVNIAASVADFVQTVESVDRDQFREFALRQLARAPGIRALTWVPRVLDASRARFEAAGRREWGPDFQIFEEGAADRPAGRRAEYFPAYYQEILTGPVNARVIGEDWGATPASLKALDQARDTGLPAMTASLRLSTGEKGVHLYWPIYRRGAPRDTVEERRENLRGFVGAVFEIGQLMELACGQLPPRAIDVALVDEGAPARERVLYSHPSPLKDPPRPWLGRRLVDDQIRAGMHWMGRIEVGGQSWAVTFTPTPGFMSARAGSEMWDDFLLGLLTTGLVGGYLLLLMWRTDTVEREVAARTQELRQAHDRLLGEISERTRAEAVAQKLARRVLTVQEEERRRLSRELHDEAGQSLTALMFHLQLLHADVPGDRAPLRQGLRDAGALVQATIQRIRLLARDLRPPALDTHGLNATLEGLCHEVARRTGVPITYTGTALRSLPPEVTICLYRVLQEAVTNVAKHAQANQVRVALQHNADSVTLSVEDDGQGFDPLDLRFSGNGDSNGSGSRGVGLLGMQERLELVGGRLEIVSRPGQGTRLIARVPVQEATSVA